MEKIDFDKDFANEENLYIYFKKGKRETYFLIIPEIIPNLDGKQLYVLWQEAAYRLGIKLSK